MLKREDIHIIAEAGTNNNGNLTKAKNLASIAQRSGADSVKFQMINPWGLYLPGNYEYGHYDIKEVLEIRKKGQMRDSEYEDLAHHCAIHNIRFSASVFDKKALDLLVRLDPPYVKLASCDLNHLSLLREVASREIKMVISTGMSTLHDVEKTVKELYRLGVDDFVLLHCVSVYPAPLDKTNLKYIKTLRKEFGSTVGFSDHTGNSVAACLALQMGATWFEKHFTEDKKQKGLDHAYAMEEGELTQYIQDITMTLHALQSDKRQLSDDELYTRKRARRAIYASRDLPTGHVVRMEDVLIVRPEGPMGADEIDLVIGKSLKSGIRKHAGFTQEVLK